MSQAFRHQGLHTLGGISKELKAQRERKEAQDKARKEAEIAAERERNLFTHFVGVVTPLPSKDRISFQQEPPVPRRLQHELDEARVLHEAMSDEFDVSTLLDVDDQMSFRRSGIGLEVTKKLRARHWSIQRQLDLHGLRSDEAREALGQFIRLAHRTGLRCIRVVHGKGLGSPGRTPILKAKVQRWLVQKKEVLAFVQARPAEGGAGALVVLLQPGKRKLY